MPDPASEPESLEKEPAPAWMTKVVGGVTLWIGVAFAALLCWMLYKIASPGVRLQVGPVIALAIVAAIATFCLSVGYRLFLNRPNRYGSILGPVSWRVMGGFFGLTGVVLLGAALFTDAYAGHASMEVVPPILGCGAFSYWCFRAAARATR